MVGWEGSMCVGLTESQVRCKSFSIDSQLSPFSCPLTRGFIFNSFFSITLKISSDFVAGVGASGASLSSLTLWSSLKKLHLPLWFPILRACHPANNCCTFQSRVFLFFTYDFSSPCWLLYFILWRAKLCVGFLSFPSFRWKGTVRKVQKVFRSHEKEMKFWRNVSVTSRERNFTKYLLNKLTTKAWKEKCEKFRSFSRHDWTARLGNGVASCRAIKNRSW